jgi:hypothetical protein
LFGDWVIWWGQKYNFWQSRLDRKITLLYFDTADFVETKPVEVRTVLSLSNDKTCRAEA